MSMVLSIAGCGVYRFDTVPRNYEPRWYRLIGKLAVPEPNMYRACSIYEDIDKRRVAVTNIGNILVSTIFLGLDHNWGDGPPLLFETLVTRNGVGAEQERCSSWQEAEEQHKRIVEEIRREIRENIND